MSVEIQISSVMARLRKSDDSLSMQNYLGNNDKERRMIIAMPVNSDGEDFDDSPDGPCGFIAQRMKLSARDPDIPRDLSCWNLRSESFVNLKRRKSEPLIYYECASK